jgi:hypothetical protein
MFIKDKKICTYIGNYDDYCKNKWYNLDGDTHDKEKKIKWCLYERSYRK